MLCGFLFPFVNFSSCFVYKFPQTTDKEIVSKQGQSAASLSEDVVYKIEIPANRYDLLCLEGLSTALRVFLGIDQAPPQFQVKNTPKENMQKIIQKKEVRHTAKIRYSTSD